MVLLWINVLHNKLKCGTSSHKPIIQFFFLNPPPTPYSFPAIEFVRKIFNKKSICSNAWNHLHSTFIHDSIVLHNMQYNWNNSWLEGVLIMADYPDWVTKYKRREPILILWTVILSWFQAYYWWFTVKQTPLVLTKHGSQSDFQTLIWLVFLLQNKLLKLIEVFSWYVINFSIFSKITPDFSLHGGILLDFR